MSTRPPALSSQKPFIHLAAFLKTLIPPIILWTVIVAIVTFAGQPGERVTPVAWLMALWCGGRYIRLVGGRQDQWPLLGPALIGATLGLVMSALFVLVSTFGMPAGPDPNEIRKALVLDLIISILGIFAGAILSMFTAWLNLNRYPK